MTFLEVDLCQSVTVVLRMPPPFLPFQTRQLHSLLESIVTIGSSVWYNKIKPDCVCIMGMSDGEYRLSRLSGLLYM